MSSRNEYLCKDLSHPAYHRHRTAAKRAGGRMRSYAATTDDWTDPGFWSSVDAGSGDNQFDLSALPAHFTADVDPATGQVTLSDGTTTHVIAAQTRPASVRGDHDGHDGGGDPCDRTGPSRDRSLSHAPADRTAEVAHHLRKRQAWDIGHGDIVRADLDDMAHRCSGQAAQAQRQPNSLADIDNIICFTPGTMILTSHGDRPIETLQPGDMVVTRDQGLRPLRWVGKRVVSGLGGSAPVRVGAKAQDKSRSGLLVSPRHRILYTGYRAELLFGDPEVLVPAAFLVDGKDVVQEPCQQITYLHMMFDHHEVIYAEGLATESFHAGDLALDALGEADRETLFATLPGLRTAPGRHIETARLCLEEHEAALLIDEASVRSGY